MKAFKRADVLLPKEEYREAFAVVACDQYTSEPQYWEQVARLVGDSPSAYHIIVPESYLGRGGVEERIASVNAEMERYLESGVFEELSDCYIYVERTLRDGKVRRGLIGMIDLKEYDYNRGSQSLIRATEATVLERIPPRVAVREHAALESPHVMILFDDREDRVFSQIEPRRLQKLYDFPLMMDSGAVRGWKVDEDTASRLDRALDAFADPTAYAQKYGVPGSPLALAVGDGNHSLATAKECYRRLCEQHGEAAMEHHPARYALVELCNLHDPSLEFEPIHRVVFGVEPERFLAEMRRSLCGGARRCSASRSSMGRNGRRSKSPAPARIWKSARCRSLSTATSPNTAGGWIISTARRSPPAWHGSPGMWLFCCRRSIKTSFSKPSSWTGRSPARPFRWATPATSAFISNAAGSNDRRVHRTLMTQRKTAR